MIKEFAFKIKVQTAEGVQEINKSINSLEGFDKRITELNKQIRATDFGSAQFKELNGELAKTRQAKQAVVEVAAAEAAAFNENTNALNQNTQAENENTQAAMQNANAQQKTGQEADKNTSAFQKYQLQIRKSRLAFQEAFASGDEKAMRKYRAEIDELEDSLEIATLKSMQLDDALAAMPGIVGFVGQSMQGLSKSFKVLAANPFVATVTLLTGLLTALFGAFSKSEQGAKSFAKVGEFAERIFNGLLQVLAPLFDGILSLVDAITKSDTAMKIIGGTVGAVAATFRGLWELVKGISITFFEFYKTIFQVGKAIAGLGGAIGKVLKGDFTGAAEDAKKVFGTVKELGVGFVKDTFARVKEGSKAVVDTYKSTADSFEKGFKKQTKAQKEANGKLLEDQKKTLEQLKKDVEAYTKSAEQSAKDSRDKDLKTEKETYDGLITRAKGNKELLAQINEAYRMKVAGINKKWDDEDQKKLEEAQSKAFDKIQKHFDKVANETSKNRELNAKREEQGLKQDLFNGLITQEEFDKKVLDNNRKTVAQKQKDDEQGYINNQATLASALATGTITLADYDAKRLELTDTYELTKQENQIAYDEADLAIKAAKFEKDKLIAQEMIKVDEATAQSKIELQYAVLDAVGTVGGLLSQFAGENKGLQKAAIILEQGSAIGKILVSSAASIASQKAAAFATGALIGGPVLNPVGYAAVMANLAKGVITTKIGAGIGIAGAIAGAAQGISQIDKADVGQSGGSGGASAPKETPRKLAAGGIVSGPGSGTSDSIPTFLSNGESVVNAESTSMFSPLLSMINQAGGGTPFNIGNRNVSSLNLGGGEPPIKTYVVSSDMTSMQMFDRAQKERSTM
jgi:hypothetical protein